MLAKQPSASEKKLDRLVEAVTTKIKSVKQQATGQGKRQKTLFSIVESSDKEEEEQ